jgi:DNA-binding NarL/FixJ family response regulator
MGAVVLPRLTPREALVLEILASGVSNKDIAAQLECSVKTVEFHITGLLRKYGVSSRLELVVKALKNRAGVYEGTLHTPGKLVR